MSDRAINVTEPFLPPLDEYVAYLKGVWDRNYLTNQGPLVRELEQKIQRYHNLEIPVHCVANGALGLQIALKALQVKGEVITTPFSYVATISCPLAEGCSVKFADIEADHLTLDPVAVEAAISPQTEAILATHVFGNPCDVVTLERVARKHGLALIYDAAHAFGVNYGGKSVLEWGDASMVSMHATKLFHSVEGGFVVAKEADISTKLEWMRRFGHRGPDDFHGVATNAKLSEVHAAMGLANFAHLGSIRACRQTVCDAYDRLLENRTDIQRAFKMREDTEWNAAYYPILCSSAGKREALIQYLADAGVNTRRYFEPSLDSVASLGVQPAAVPVSHDITSRILCLPLSASMTQIDIERVVGLLERSTV